jgi:AcrR family transcriptional regulator
LVLQLSTNDGDDEGDLAVSDAPRRPKNAGGAPAKIDGRFLRTERTRQRIIEAYLALLRSGGKDPTSNEIAAHAGCSVRSVFERFHDMAALRVAAADHLFADTSPAPPSALAGDRQARLHAHIGAHAELCERIMPLWRTMHAHQGESPSLRQHITQTRAAARAMTEQTFASELAPLAAERRRQILIVIESIIDFDNWSHMRDHHGLSAEEASAVWTSAVDRLLP